MYPSPEAVNAVVAERRRDSLRVAEMRRLLREAGIERPSGLKRFGYRLSQVARGLLLAVGSRLVRDESSPRMPAVEPPAISRA